MKMLKTLKLFIILALGFSSANAFADESSNTRIGVDLYAVQNSLMPYKGYQNDISATFYLKYKDLFLVPFVRAMNTNYYFLNETTPGATDYTTDNRKAAGGGLDINITSYLKIRLISEYVMNQLTNTQYSQESYGLIYNQYLNLKGFDLNNYAEVFNIPRLSSQTTDTFVRIQALKPFVFAATASSSNTLFPFAQYKLKANDNTAFGISGSQISFGLGYKYYNATTNNSSLAFLLEGHSVTYQSVNFNGDWLQMLAAIQFLYN